MSHDFSAHLDNLTLAGSRHVGALALRRLTALQVLAHLGWQDLRARRPRALLWPLKGHDYIRALRYTPERRTVVLLDSARYSYFVA